MAHADDREKRPVDPATAARFVRTSAAGAVRVVELVLPTAIDSDEFDALNAALLGQMAGADRWVLDLSAVTYMGSSMLGLVVNIRQRVKAAGGRLVLCGLPPWLAQTMRTCSLEKLFVTTVTRSEAVAVAERG